jgi:hypothetical protein
MTDRPEPTTAAKAARTAAAGGAILSIGAALVGPISPADAATFDVTTNADAGAGSLRQAILDANGSAGADTVNVPAGLGTISLSTGEIPITDDLTIVGAGAASVTVSGNSASRIFYVSSTADVVTISGVTLTDGTETAGGAIYARSVNLTVQQSVITGSDATNGSGGAIALYSSYAPGDSSLTLTDSTLSGNTATDDGGAVKVHTDDELVSITGSTITGNTAGGYGGGVALRHVYDVTIASTVVSGNTAGGKGGGLYLHAHDPSTVTISTSTISGNTATGDDGGGAFLYGFATATIDRTTISDNHATYEGGANGGGLFVYWDDGTATDLTVSSSTITGNSATGYGGGLGTYGVNSTISHSTIADNSAAYGGGVAAYDGTLDLDHVILSGNQASVDGDEVFTNDGVAMSMAHSLVEGAVVGVTPTDGGGNITGQSAQLLPLAANGGPNQTRALPATSPALNAGDAAFTAPPATDQRGLARVQGGRIDIGAFEVQDPVAPTTTTTTPTTPTTPTTTPAPAARAVTATPTFTG